MQRRRKGLRRLPILVNSTQEGTWPLSAKTDDLSCNLERDLDMHMLYSTPTERHTGFHDDAT